MGSVASGALDDRDTGISQAVGKRNQESWTSCKNSMQLSLAHVRLQLTWGSNDRTIVGVEFCRLAVPRHIGTVRWPTVAES